MTDTKLIELHKTQTRNDLPQLKAGMKVKVWYKIKEGDKIRTTFFEGIVIAVKHGQKNSNATFTVRKISVDNVGVEMTWLLHSPVIDRIEVLNIAKTRRNKLYYLRRRSTRQVKSKLRKKSEFKELEIPETQMKTDETQINAETESAGDPGGEANDSAVQEKAAQEK